MNSIEIINEINHVDFVDQTADEAAESKAKHWIRLGVRAAIAEAVTFAKSDLIDAEDAAIEFGHEAETVAEDLRESIRILSSSFHEDFLVQRGWALRKESK
jgi:hypothetical protein